MREIIKDLRDQGCDTDGALARFLGDTEMYLDFLFKFTKEPAFDMLLESLEKKDYQEAFNAAHTLKGSAAALGLTPLYESVCKVVEDLRGLRDLDSLQEDYDEMRSAQQDFLKIMEFSCRHSAAGRLRACDALQHERLHGRNYAGQ